MNAYTKSQRIALNPAAQLHQMFIMELSMYGEREAKMFVSKLPSLRKTMLTTYWTENGYQDYLDNFVEVKVLR